MKTATAILLLALILGLLITTVACSKTTATTATNDIGAEMTPADNPDIGTLDDLTVSEDLPQ